MMNFVNQLEFSDKEYQTNRNKRDENYKGKFLFSMNNFVSFGIDPQSKYFMSTGLIKDNIDGVCVPQFQISYNHNTYNPLPKN